MTSHLVSELNPVKAHFLCQTSLKRKKQTSRLKLQLKTWSLDDSLHALSVSNRIINHADMTPRLLAASLTHHRERCHPSLSAHRSRLCG